MSKQSASPRRAGHRSNRAVAPGQGDRSSSRRLLTRLAGIGTVLAITALVNHRLAQRAVQRNPPAGQFINVDGVRLHYIERGVGPPLVLLHGNGTMIQDFESSGLIERASRTHRVIVFDRPGFGHSARPRGPAWSADAQARLIHTALERIGASSAVVLGHSWGASVAVALALRYPHSVSGLVLASGYYYPSARVDFALMSGPAIPVLGDILRYTLAPIISRAIWPLLMRRLFGPAQVPEKFRGFPKELALRPSQLRASAMESALLVPMAAAMSHAYETLKMPVVILVGAQDRLVNAARQSGRLHRDIAQSRLRVIPEGGHMVHQTDPEAVISAIKEVEGLAAMGAQAREIMKISAP